MEMSERRPNALLTKTMQTPRQKRIRLTENLIAGSFLTTIFVKECTFLPRCLAR
jgi:hypothetical protein